MKDIDTLYDDAKAAIAAEDHAQAALLLSDLFARQPDHGQAQALAMHMAAIDYSHAARFLHENRTEEAWPILCRCLTFRPQDGESWLLAAIVQRRLRDIVGLIHSAERAIALLPGDPRPLNLLAEASAERGEFAAAVAVYDSLLSLSPQDDRAHTNLIFALNFLPETDTARQQAERKRWDQLHGSGRHGLPTAPERAKIAERRLRIGYVTSFFRRQAATPAFAPLLLDYDRSRFEVFCYSATIDGDDLTERFRAAATGWRDIADLSDEAAAQQVRLDGIDILVDCAGHMAGHRLGIFVQKPAPVQITAWGEPTGTGLAAMDWLLADPILIPPDERPLLAEKVWDLPCFLGYWRLSPLPAPAPLPALRNGYVTFGSFSRTAKLSQAALELWAALLAALPDSRLLLKDRDFYFEDQRTRALTLLAGRGIDPRRIEIAGGCSLPEHFARYGDVDIALDPTPHGGGMTTLDALWMGVPVITLLGHSISSRLAASCLSAVGLGDWITTTSDAYVARAKDAVSDLTALEGLRQNLRQQMAASEIGDPVRWVAAVERAYRGIWRRYCAPASPHLAANDPEKP